MCTLHCSGTSRSTEISIAQTATNAPKGGATADKQTLIANTDARGRGAGRGRPWGPRSDAPMAEGPGLLQHRSPIRQEQRGAEVAQ